MPEVRRKIRIPAQSDPAFATETDSAEQAEPPDGATASRSAAGREPEREIPAAKAATKATRATAPVASGARVSESSAGGPSRASDPITEAPTRCGMCVRPPVDNSAPPMVRSCGAGWEKAASVRIAGVAGRLARLEDGGAHLSVAGSFAAASAGVGVGLACRRTPTARSSCLRTGRRPRGAAGARSKRSGRHVAIVVALALMCVGLVAALYIVLSGQR